MPASQQLDHVFHALADPYRRSMVERLSRGPASVKQLAAPIDLALPSAVKHLKVLEDGGLVVSKKAGRVRTYTIKPQALASIGRWVKQRETAMNQAFDRLAQAMTDFPEQDTK
ncbi:MAG: ArsR/SmtB family transcription factor [Afipia sp.]